MGDVMERVAADHLRRVLALAAAERNARFSPLWKTGLEAAIERHADACDALYAELYRLLDERSEDGVPVAPAETEESLRRKIEKEITAALKAALPDMISEALHA